MRVCFSSHPSDVFFYRYAYPPPDANILANITNALIAVPPLYTQVSSTVSLCRSFFFNFRLCSVDIDYSRVQKRTRDVILHLLMTGAASNEQNESSTSFPPRLAHTTST